MAEITRVHGKPCRHSTGLSPAYETLSKIPPVLLQTERRLSASPDPFITGDPSQPGRLDAYVLCSEGQTLSHFPPISRSDHRCVAYGMGRPLCGGDGLAGLVTSTHLTSYQCVGDEGCHQLPSAFPTQVSRSNGLDSHRQQVSCSVHQSPRRHPIKLSQRPSCGALGVVPPCEDRSSCLVYTRQRQPDSRFSVPGSVPTIRMVAPPGDIPVYPSPLGTPGNRLVCHGSQPEVADVLLSCQRNRSNFPGCILHSLGGSKVLCVSSVPPNTAGIEESEGRSSLASSSGPQLAKEVLVPTTPRTVGGGPAHTSSEIRHSISTSVGDHASSASGPPLNRMAVIGQDAKALGLSDRASQLVIQSHRNSTLDLYNSRLGRFSDWCTARSVDPRNASLAAIADFFVHLFDIGRSLSTIRGFRSAIAAFHSGFPDGSNVSNSSLLSRLMRAFFLKRPPKKRLTPSWSLPAVLNTLAKPPFEPLAKSSLHDLSIKTAFLIAVASGQRRSSIHALTISPGHIRWEWRGVRLIPTPSFIAKNQTATSGSIEFFLAPLSDLSSVTEDKVWCPVRALKWYLDRTKTLRNSDQLFVTSCEPFAAASRDTISRWIVEAIKSAGDDALLSDTRPRAHDTRSIATSWALFNGVALDDILRAAFWRSSNSFTSFYLKDIPSGEALYASSALRAAAPVS
ncbi:uncharacterized protein LOC135154172 [Lytechinus pictus]|uniref:uncharacterized protein LOC135154172 n=1 Tax=Lytechinus pictus TaxID=7653 RepID=UPI0030BA157E